MIFQNEKSSASDAGHGYDTKNKKVQHSIIGSDLKIKGDLESTGDITIDGTVEGKIKCRTLILGEAPIINSSVEADTVRICGVFSGEVKARKVVLTRTAKVSGDIYHETLQVDEGATIEGRIARLSSRKTSDVPMACLRRSKYICMRIVMSSITWKNAPRQASEARTRNRFSARSR